MLSFVFRKILNKRWMAISLLIGNLLLRGEGTFVCVVMVTKALQSVLCDRQIIASFEDS